MSDPLFYRIAADALLILHAAFVAFAILALLLVLLGKPFGWQWIYHFWFRMAHLGAIGVVVAQSWLGMICPLTIWEMQLRAAAGDATYRGGFVAHWIYRLLYYQAPPWVFTLIYTLFGGLVLLAWFWVRPRRGRLPGR